MKWKPALHWRGFADGWVGEYQLTKLVSKLTSKQKSNLWSGKLKQYCWFQEQQHMASKRATGYTYSFVNDDLFCRNVTFIDRFSVFSVQMQQSEIILGRSPFLCVKVTLHWLQASGCVCLKNCEENVLFYGKHSDAFRYCSDHINFYFKSVYQFCTVINHYLPENLIACRKTYRAYLPDFFGNTVPLVPVDVPVRMSALLSHWISATADLTPDHIVQTRPVERGVSRNC